MYEGACTVREGHKKHSIPCARFENPRGKATPLFPLTVWTYNGHRRQPHSPGTSKSPPGLLGPFQAHRMQSGRTFHGLHGFRTSPAVCLPKTNQMVNLRKSGSSYMMLMRERGKPHSTGETQPIGADTELALQKADLPVVSGDTSTRLTRPCTHVRPFTAGL